MMLYTRKWNLVVGFALAFGQLGCALDMAEEEEEPGSTVVEARPFTADPVIFVHGCNPPGFTDDQSDFGPMVDYFRSHGYPESHLVLFVNQEEQCTSVARFAAQLEDLVKDVQRATGKSKVDVVGMSMGSTATRYYFWKEGRVATDSVRDFVSIAGPHHGSTGGIFVEWDALHWQDAYGGYPWFEGVDELTPPYACQGEAYGASGGEHSPTEDIQFEINGCLTPTGRTVNRDETLGAVRVVAVRNTIDDIVVPAESSCLNQRFQNDCADPVNVAVTIEGGGCGEICPSHLATVYDPGVIARTYNFVRGGAF